MNNDLQKNNGSNQGTLEMLISKRVQLILTVVSLLVLISGIYLTAQLSPLIQDIALNRQAVAENKEDINRLDLQHAAIEEKLDTLLGGQAKLEGILLGK